MPRGILRAGSSYPSASGRRFTQPPQPGLLFMDYSRCRGLSVYENSLAYLVWLRYFAPCGCHGALAEIS